MLNNPFKILLLICLVCSKEILVFNEEILIVLAFSIFIYLTANSASSMIADELNEKSKAIKTKFDVYKNIQEKTIMHLLSYHSKREILADKIKTISQIRKLRIDSINNYCKTSLSKQTFLHLEDTLNRFVLNEYVTNATFQEAFVLKLSKLKQNLNAKKK